MHSEWFYVTSTAFVMWMCCLNLSMAGPFPEDTMALPSRKFLKSSAISPVSVFAETRRNSERNGNDYAARRKGGSSDRPSVVNDVKLMYRLPPSPANLLKPDAFKFYTYNDRGDMITKQMTPQEIQALIASGGPDHSNIGVQEPQKAEDILTGGKKVMDVVEKVQSVLKSAMNKTPTLMGTMSNPVPETANVEWSNILPALLGGDKHGNITDDTAYVERSTTTATSTTVRNDYTVHNTFVTAFSTTDNGIKFSETKEDKIPQGFGEDRTKQTTSIIRSTPTTTAYTPTEKFMIPVAVITTEEKPQLWRSTTQSPVFQKITEILPTNDVANVGNSNDNSNRLPSNGSDLDSATSNVSTVPLDATKTSILSSESTISVESTTSAVYSSTGEAKPTSVADTSTTSTTLSSSKTEEPITNELLTTTPVSSVTAVTRTDQSSTPSALEMEVSTTSSTSLPMELINSLSSMIGQVSEIPASPILPISTDLQGQSSHVEEKNRKNSSEVYKSATASSIDVPIKLSTIDEDEERTAESLAATTSTVLPRVDQAQVTWTIPPASSSAPSTNQMHSDGGVNFTRISTSSTNSTSSEKSTDTETAVTKGPLDATTNAMLATVKPLDSVKTNATEIKSLSKISDVKQQSSNIDPIAMIESMLETVSTEANIRSTEPLALPNVPPEILPPKTLASGLIAGYEFTDSNRNATAAIDGDAPSKPEAQTPEGSLTSKNETRTSPANETIYVKIPRPSSSVEEPATFKTVQTTASTTNQEDVQVETSTIATTDSSVSDAAASTDAVADSSNVSPSTTVSSEESSVLFDSKKPVSQTTSNVDETTEPSVIAKLDDTPLEAFKKDDATTSTESDGLDRVSSTESIVQVVRDTSTTSESTSTDASVDAAGPTISSIANATVTDASISTNKETKDPPSTTIDTLSTNVSNKTNSVDVEPTTESIYPSTRTELKLNVTHNASKNETEKLGGSTNATDDGNLDDKWQRITLHETAPTSPTKSAVQEIGQGAESTTTRMTTTTIVSSTLETNAAETETKYQTTPVSQTATTVTLNPSKNTGGLDSSTKNASNDIVNFTRLCNELAFKFWIAANKGLSTGRSLALSPFGMISLLAMIFLGARGSTSDQMNEVLGLDNVATFNPHLIFQNVTDAVGLARNQGIANAAFVRELFADKVKIRKLLPFYKEQAQQFYEGLVAEVNFATISDLARRRTNLLIRKQTGGRIRDFVKSNAVPLRSPLAAISANVFQTDCNTSLASTMGRDGELYFAVSSAHRLRKLIPVPATVWRSNVLAGYEPSLDATAIGLGGIGKLVSTIFLLPGQQGHAAPGDTLDRLEQRLIKGAFRDDTWNKLLKVLIPRRGLELQIPKFSHRSVVNATAALKRMGLDQLFSSDADFKGINGIGNRLFLSDVLQMNLFSTCGDENTANGRHHVEIYPASPVSRHSSRQDYEHRTADVEEQLDSDSAASTFDFRLKNHRRTVSASGTTPGVSEKQTEDRPRLKLDQPFLYFVRHNPTGLILHMGRFNPRLL